MIEIAQKCQCGSLFVADGSTFAVSNGEAENETNLAD